MTQEIWNQLSFFEQLSNVDGEVRRLVEAHEGYKCGKVPTDYSTKYLEKIIKLIEMTMNDPKNVVKGYRSVELYDEIEEIKRYISGEISSGYILRYWDTYTNAIS